MRVVATPYSVTISFTFTIKINIFTITLTVNIYGCIFSGCFLSSCFLSRCLLLGRFFATDLAPTPSASLPRTLSDFVASFVGT
jgi:hypothetical protein